MPKARGISEDSRALLDALHREFREPFSVAQAARLWAMDQRRARRLLAHLAAQGWLSRVRRDAYVTVPLGATAPSEWRADPWLVAATVFEPCYLAGWTACEHWGLTEQIFRSLWIVTSRRVSPQVQEIQGTTYNIKVTSSERLFGLATVWRDDSKVQVSNPSRTIVDLLDDPRLGGGMRHISEVLATYFRSDHRNDGELLSFAERLGNGAVFKRLGYLLETLDIASPKLATACRERMTGGVSDLDPSGPQTGSIDRRWRVRANVHLTGTAE